MTRSGQVAGRPPLGSIAAGSSRSAARPGVSGLAGKAALGLIGLGVVGHALRSRRFRERVIVGVIVLGALRGLGQESRASTFARVAAWNKRQVEILERKAERQSAHLALKAERQRGRLERKARRQARRLHVGQS
jgi:regulator of protease activity HflC (stomatin/prohibitin superfamily)